METPEFISICIGDTMLPAYVSDIPAYIYEKLTKKQSMRCVHNAQSISIPVNISMNEMLRKTLNKATEDEHYELVPLSKDEMK